VRRANTPIPHLTKFLQEKPIGHPKLRAQLNQQRATSLTISDNISEKHNVPEHQLAKLLITEYFRVARAGVATNRVVARSFSVATTVVYRTLVYI